MRSQTMLWSNRVMMLLVLILSTSVVANAQESGEGKSRASAPTSSFHLYRSNDRGVSWSRIGKGLPNVARIHALAVQGATACAGTDDGVFVSVDGGSTWSARVMTPASAVHCFSFVGRRVYAGTRKAGVFVSEDKGHSWRRIADGLTDPNVRSLVSRDSVVYAGTDSKGVFELPDGDDHWTPFGHGLPEHPQVFDLAVKGRDIYAALYSNGLYRLEASGGRWERVGEVTPLRFLIRGDSFLAGHNPGGIFRSVNEGATWQRAAGLPSDAPIWVLGTAGPNVLAGTSPGAVSLSDDFGATWKLSAAGLSPGAAVIAIGDDHGVTLVAIHLLGDD